ncbi:MAG: hypothetical protein IT379_36905 [Deltaproteobacteria bacterium]|nr:hypothetical protein [Deltaproteobacteria bacterium]
MAAAKTSNGNGHGHGARRVTAAARKRHDALIRELAAARRLRADGWDKHWELVGEVLSDGLYEAGGAHSAQGWIAQHLAEPYRTAFRSVRVAQHAEPADEARYGVERLDAAIAYMETVIGPTVKGKPPVPFGELKIPVSRRGKPRSLGLLEVAPDEICAAVESAAADHGAKPSRGRGASTDGPLSTAQRAVRTLRSVRLRAVDGHVSFGHVPLGQLEVALRALARVDWRALTDAPPASGPLANPVARALVVREKSSARSR